MSFDADCDEFIKNKLFRSKGKCDIYARQSDVCVAVKQKSTFRATAPTLPMAEGNNNNVISMRYDIWFHISMHIDPEDVQTFALICKQTSRLVASRAFWRNLYRRHCTGATSGWNLNLPAELQLESIRNCKTRALKSLVIAALFHCHRPLKVRLELGYNLDWMLQRIFVSCFQTHYQCLWIMCYKFWNRQSHEQDETETHTGEVVNDWESLADDDATKLAPTFCNPHEGVVLLVVICRHFVPTSNHLAYGPQQQRYRLRATRELLCTDMRAKNLELDFAEDGCRNVSVTVKHDRIEKYKVLPWWHPDFQRFVK
uniref:Fates-shifted n=3 Tax=Drosophila melanogaster TaxID=7227 RepID=A1Z9A5_DROME|nr:fates-shifted [Drosophila melanogaster]AAF58401.2 fates-shifted [Drosophila melanogaster]AOQ14911.1 fsd-PA [synthetic construct]|eukprot:NP_610851.2 fates-shifted [Drosophila melanogaster]